MSSHYVTFSLHNRLVLERTYTEQGANLAASRRAGMNGVGTSASCPCWIHWRNRKPAPLCAVDDEGLLHIDGCVQVPDDN